MASYNLEAPRCQHIKDSGIQCGSPALRGESFCYHHKRIHYPRFRPGQKGYIIPALETPEAVTLATIQIAQAAHDGTLSLPVARLLLNAVRLAAPYAGKHYSYAPDVVTELPPSMRAASNIAVTLEPGTPASTPVSEDHGRAAALGCPAEPTHLVESLPDAPCNPPAPIPPISAPPDHQISNSPDTEMSSSSDEQIRDSIFHPDPDAVLAYWTQHLPPEVANERGCDGELLYQPPTWLPLTPEQLAYLRDHQPPDHAPGTPEEQENYERMTLHFTHYNVRPPKLEEVLKNRRELAATGAFPDCLFAAIKKLPQKAG